MRHGTQGALLLAWALTAWAQEGGLPELPEPPPGGLSVEARVVRSGNLLAAGQSEAALALCREGLEADSTALPLYRALAAVHARNGRPREAIAALEAALVQDPDYLLVYLDLGGIYTTLAEFAKARGYLERALALDPEQPMVRRRLGELYLGEGQPARAEEQLRLAIARNPGDAALHLSLAKALEALEQAPAAWQAYQTACRLDLGNEEAFTRAALLARRLGHLPQADSALAAAQHLQALSRRGPTEASTLAGLRRALADLPEEPQHSYNLGVFYAAQGYLPEALNQFERVLVLRPGDARALNRAGDVHLQLQQPEAALRAYRLALAQAPDYALAQLNAGQACMRLRRPAEALVFYQQAVRLAPQVPVAWHQLALCHLALDQPAAADSVLGLALGQVRAEGRARTDLEVLRGNVRRHHPLSPPHKPEETDALPGQ